MNSNNKIDSIGSELRDRISAAQHIQIVATRLLLDKSATGCQQVNELAPLHP